MVVVLLEFLNVEGDVIMSKKGYEQESSVINIRSIQAASLYRVNNGYKFVLKRESEDGSFIKEYKESFLEYGNTVISNSLFAKYVCGHGVVVNKYNRSLDFLMMKFDWGVDEDSLLYTTAPAPDT